MWPFLAVGCLWTSHIVDACLRVRHVKQIEPPIPTRPCNDRRHSAVRVRDGETHQLASVALRYPAQI